MRRGIGRGQTIEKHNKERERERVRLVRDA